MGFQIIAAAESLIEERQREVERLMLVARVREADVGGRPGPVRHVAALALATVSRITASAVRRLDRCLADDLGRQLAAADRG